MSSAVPSPRQPETHHIPGLVLGPQDKIVSFDLAARDTTVYVALEVHTTDQGMLPEHHAQVWFWKVTTDGRSLSIPLVLARDMAFAPRIVLDGDSVFIAYAMPRSVGLFAAEIGGQDWRSRAVSGELSQYVRALAWRPVEGYDPSLLIVLSADNPTVATEDTMRTQDCGLWLWSMGDRKPRLRQLVSAPRVFGDQCQPTVGSNGMIAWASQEILGKATAMGSAGTPVSRVYVIDPSSGSVPRSCTRQGSEIAPPICSTAIYCDGEKCTLLAMSGSLLALPLDRSGRGAPSRTRSILDPRWLGMTSCLQVMREGATDELVWIDGRHQKDPLPRLGLAGLPMDIGPLPSADIYIGHLTSGEALTLDRARRLTAGTPLVRSIRVVQHGSATSIFWAGKANAAVRDLGDQLFVMRVAQE